MFSAIFSCSWSFGCRGRCRRRSGIAKLEVIVTAIILLIAVGLFFPFVQQRRAAARRMLCENRIENLALAAHGAEKQFGRWPGYAELQGVRSDGTRGATSWVFPLLLHLKLETDPSRSTTYASEYEEYGPGGPMETRGQRLPKYIPEIVCPEWGPDNPSTEPLWLSYVANTGMPDADVGPEVLPDLAANGLFVDLFRETTVAFSFPSFATVMAGDGANQTLMISENVDAGYGYDRAEPRVGFVWQPPVADNDVASRATRPYRINEGRGAGDGTYRFARPASFHGRGALVAFAGGHTQFLNQDIDDLVYCHLMTSNGSQIGYPGTTRPIAAPYRTPEAEVEGGSQR